MCIETLCCVYRHIDLGIYSVEDYWSSITSYSSQLYQQCTGSNEQNLHQIALSQ